MATKKKNLTVSAPLVQVSLGDRVLQLYRGDIVPEGVEKESIDHLKDLGFVTEGDAAESDEN